MTTGLSVYDSPVFTTTVAGTYRWVASLADGSATLATNPCNDPAEMVVVAQIVPSLTTRSSAGVVGGSPVTDTATLELGFNPTGFVAFNFYGPNVPPAR